MTKTFQDLIIPYLKLFHTSIFGIRISKDRSIRISPNQKSLDFTITMIYPIHNGICFLTKAALGLSQNGSRLFFELRS